MGAHLLFLGYTVTMETPQRNALWQALNMALELGYTIAIPLVVLALAGRWADTQFHTGPWLFLAGIVLAIVSSSILLIRKFSKLLRDTTAPPSA